MPRWTSISDSEYGRLAETVACWWLRLRGYSILARNVRVLRTRGRCGRPAGADARRLRGEGAPQRAAAATAEEMVDAWQQRRLLQAAEVLLAAPIPARGRRASTSSPCTACGRGTSGRALVTGSAHVVTHT